MYVLHSLIGVLCLFIMSIIWYNIRSVMMNSTKHGGNIHIENTTCAHSDNRISSPITSNTWRVPELPDNLQNADQYNSDLINHIRTHWIIPPSGNRISLDDYLYKGRKRDDFSQFRQPSIVLDILDDRRNGFYVECGAADGQISSNSLYLELFYNWSGLLIEPNPDLFASLLDKNRQAYMVNSCLSPTSKPMLLSFTPAGIGGGISDLIPANQLAMRRIRSTKPINIQCFPLYSILAALDIKHIDYFSLDIEGAEVDVLKTLSFDHVTTDVISVEKRIIDDPKETEKKQKEIEAILRPHGFIVKTELRLDVILSRI